MVTRHQTLRRAKQSPGNLPDRTILNLVLYVDADGSINNPQQGRYVFADVAISSRVRNAFVARRDRKV